MHHVASAGEFKKASRILLPLELLIEPQSNVSRNTGLQALACEL
jgi:hypothetical protein